MNIHKILDYCMYSPENTNKAILIEMLERLGGQPDGHFSIEDVVDYVMHTKWNTNRAVLETMLKNLKNEEKEWTLVAESIGNGRIVWDSTGEIVWKEGEISCEKFALLQDIFINPYCYRAFFRIEESQEFPVHYDGSGNPSWEGVPALNKRVIIVYESIVSNPLDLTMQAKAGAKCQLYIKKVEEVETFTINWANDYQIYTNINISDTLVSPLSPPLEPGYVFETWYVGREELEENKDFTFTNEIARCADETKTIYASYYAFQPEP